VLLAGAAWPASSETAAQACTCLVWSDPIRQRAEDIKNADVVFRGRVVDVVQRPHPRAGFTIWSDPLDAPRGCLRVSMSRACPEMPEAKVIVRDGRGVELRTRKTGRPREVQVCGLAAGPYAVEILASGPPTQRYRQIVTSGSGLMSTANVECARTTPYDVSVFLAVSGSLKGKVPSVVEISTWEDSASCGYPYFEIGGEYLVFSRRERYGDREVLEASMCEGTRRVDIPAGRR
jgi:hypothetical protein